MLTKSINDNRYESKFVVTTLSRQQIILIVKTNPAMFSEIYHSRFVNNIYFDSPGMNSFFDNTCGRSKRTKVRIRWYGDLFGYIENPVLEFKIKQGSLGKKESYAIKPFTINKGFSCSKIVSSIAEADIPAEVKMKCSFLDPVLINRYERKYFLSAGDSYRITIDSDISYHYITSHNSSFMRNRREHGKVVVELKYNYNMEKGASEIASRFPFRLSRNSKYINGVLHLYNT